MEVKAHTTENGVHRQKIHSNGGSNHGCCEAKKFVDHIAISEDV
jgi:hypothetical protein